jgi:RNA polymerase sigma-70 factor, ECF subfamily
MTGTEGDEELMRRTAVGDAPALERLIRRHATPLFSFLVRISGNRHQAEELFQEAFLLVWTKRHLYEFPRPFRPWLFALALNCWRAQLRQRPLPPSQACETAIDPGASPEAGAEATENASLVARALQALPPRQREVVILRVWEELPYARIARIVGVPEATARSHMRLALASLRTLLSPGLGEPDEIPSRGPANGAC